MSCILSIDTSTNVCSVAVSQDGACIYYDEDNSGPNHAEKLGVFVDQAMSFADSHAIPLDAVAVSSGPGCRCPPSSCSACRCCSVMRR